MTSLSQGAWLVLGEALTARSIAALGFDWLGIDSQHGRFDDAGVRLALELLPVGAPPALVRVRSNDYGLIGRALDSGAQGVIVPMVNSAVEARVAVAAANYPPVGTRSWGPMTGAYGSPAAVVRHALTCSVMIETPAALDAVDEIAAVPGVDMLFVGPFDLAIALGLEVDLLLSGADAADPLPRIVAAAKAAGISAGAFAGSPERGAVLAALGFEVVAVATEATLLERGAASML
jgi:4-hydroxy-2-oxoheptanedioate aldolase